MTTLTSPPTVRSQVAQLAGRRISTWQRDYLADTPAAVAALARLRRGAGREAGQLPDLWDLVDTAPLHDVPEGARPLSERQLVCAEDALHTAMTLWALHQQSRPAGIHQPGNRSHQRGLGAAVHRMMQQSEVNEPLRKRLVRAGTAPDLTALAQRLRDIVVLLRREDIAQDYALLAGQLYTWQQEGGADTVRREWGRSFHAWHEPAPDEDTTAGTAPDTGAAGTSSSSTHDKDAS
ncbi:type I-E CRISPR-associated protein Cse2/CasB [Streptomyces sp. NPDC007025]|uniref:type I-E CRISPR-associated protein Cse2/CasB n=1 Tax=Streptomyces sp. NPDC007025 TaxID=3364771 RepID=UPI0036A7D358